MGSFLCDLCGQHRREMGAEMCVICRCRNDPHGVSEELDGLRAREDKLDETFRLQEAFMRRLSQASVGFPQDWPLDLSQRSSQVEVRDAVFHSIEELIEVVRELKNAKKHRQTEVKEFDREKLVEECVDAFKLFLEALIFMGVTPDEFFAAYLRKDAIIHARLDANY